MYGYYNNFSFLAVCTVRTLHFHTASSTATGYLLFKRVKEAPGNPQSLIGTKKCYGSL